MRMNRSRGDPSLMRATSSALFLCLRAARRAEMVSLNEVESGETARLRRPDGDNGICFAGRAGLL